MLFYILLLISLIIMLPFLIILFLMQNKKSSSSTNTKHGRRTKKEKDKVGDKGKKGEQTVEEVLFPKGLDIVEDIISTGEHFVAVWRVEPINVSVLNGAELERVYQAYRNFFASVYVPVSIYATIGYVDLDQTINDFTSRSQKHPILPKILGDHVAEHMKSYSGRIKTMRYYIAVHMEDVNIIHSIENSLSVLSRQSGLRFERLKLQDLFRFLSEFVDKETAIPLSRFAAQEKNRKPKLMGLPATIIESYKQVEFYTPGETKYTRSFFALFKGGSTSFGFLRLILRMFEPEEAGEVDFVLHVEPISVDAEIHALERKIADLIAERKDATPGKADALDQEIADLRARQLRLRTNQERPFSALLQFVVSAKSEEDLNRVAQIVRKEFLARGFELLPPHGEHLKAFSAALPTAPASVRTSFMQRYSESLETTNVADLFPFTRYGLPYSSGIVVGTDPSGDAVLWNPWDPALPNQHMIVIGRSGAGKSFATMLLLVRSSLWGIEHAVLDWKGEYFDLATLLNIPFISLSEKSPDRINPFDLEIVTDPSGQMRVNLHETIASVQSLVIRMLRTYDYATRDVRLVLPDLIRQLYAKRGITEDPRTLFISGNGKFSTRQTRKEMPTLSELYELMRTHTLTEVQRAAEGLKQFTQYGPLPSFAIFDGQSTREDLAQAPLLVFALDKLEQDVMRPIAMTAVTQWLANRWAKARPSTKKRIFVEEAQNLFLDPDAGPWLESAYRELRAYNTGVVSITQGLEVYLRNEHGRAALRNSTIKIIGRQEGVDIERVGDVLQLSEGEKNYVLNARTGQFLFRIDEVVGFVNVEASTLEHMLYTSDPNDPLYVERKRQVREKLSKLDGKEAHPRWAATSTG